jgi:hypothetical protein
MTGTLEQLEAELVFQLRDLCAQPRLGNILNFGSLAEMQGLSESGGQD